MPTYTELVQMQSLPMQAKVVKTQQRIKEWYEHWGGKVYVSFSGGKDSTVLLHIVRDLYPHVPAVFINTGLEYPEIVQFVRTVNNVTWLKPKMPFTKVIEKYGFPVVSKEQSEFIYEIAQKSEKLRSIRLNGNRWGKGKVFDRWIPLTYAPFKVSNKCCDVMKENPAKSYERKNGLKPYVGTMASESERRTVDFTKYGCNAFNANRPMSRPLSFWFESDAWEYLRAYNVPYSKVYDMGYSRTGCMFCMFGVHMESYPNKFQRMYGTHPKLWDYCIHRLGCGQVLDYIHVPYIPNQMEMDLGV